LQQLKRKLGPAAIASALRDVRSKGHRNLRRRRLRQVPIEAHHLTEQRATVES
jgi:hypothetical protein